MTGSFTSWGILEILARTFCALLFLAVAAGVLATAFLSVFRRVITGLGARSCVLRSDVRFTILTFVVCAHPRHSLEGLLRTTKWYVGYGKAYAKRYGKKEQRSPPNCFGAIGLNSNTVRNRAYSSGSALNPPAPVSSC